MKNQRITRDEFYAYGGFSNPQLLRKQWGTSYTYWRKR